MSGGGRDPVAEASRGGVDVDGSILEYGTPRAGSIAPLRYLTGGKVAVPGVVATKTPELLSKDDLRRRIGRGSEFAGGGCLAQSPRCGFASTLVGNKVTAEDQRRKLELVVETAAGAWARG
jgi:5-methyltetrahydropteroyltriglutamate--homocysteine methyltransferase